jgi:hypothetical protein
MDTESRKRKIEQAIGENHNKKLDIEHHIAKTNVILQLCWHEIHIRKAVGFFLKAMMSFETGKFTVISAYHSGCLTKIHIPILKGMLSKSNKSDCVRGFEMIPKEIEPNRINAFLESIKIVDGGMIKKNKEGSILSLYFDPDDSKTKTDFDSFEHIVLHDTATTNGKHKNGRWFAYANLKEQ